MSEKMLKVLRGVCQGVDQVDDGVYRVVFRGRVYYVFVDEALNKCYIESPYCLFKGGFGTALIDISRITEALMGLSEVCDMVDALLSGGSESAVRMDKGFSGVTVSVYGCKKKKVSPCLRQRYEEKGGISWGG